MAIDWLQAGANATAILVAGGSGLAWYRKYMAAQMRQIVMKEAILKPDYESFQDRIEKELDGIKQFQVEFKTIAIEVKQVKDGQDRLQQAIKDHAQEQSKQLTNSMNAIRDRFDDMKDLIQANK